MQISSFVQNTARFLSTVAPAVVRENVHGAIKNNLIQPIAVGILLIASGAGSLVAARNMDKKRSIIRTGLALVGTTAITYGLFILAMTYRAFNLPKAQLLRLLDNKLHNPANPLVLPSITQADSGLEHVDNILNLLQGAKTDLEFSVYQEAALKVMTKISALPNSNQHFNAIYARFDRLTKLQQAYQIIRK